MSDLIKRLRGWPGPRGKEVSILRTMTEAADKIGDMQDEIEKLRAALKQARRDALEEAVSRVTAYSQNETARNIVTIIYALGEKE
jgi:hypothetical protein